MIGTGLGNFFKDLGAFFADNVFAVMAKMRIVDVIDILLLTLLLFFAYRFIRNRRASKLALGMLLIIAFMAILSNSICWTLRTNAMKVIDATVVSVMMPFSAVVTGVLSAIVGFDSISPGLIMGAVIVLAASILSGLGDHKK